ncbi:hypothetical protein AB0D54_23135 [Streptomyces xanthophaeus]|uniref:hypothetical protein n=1 Tax=Streptomyces xanthophaeus TaxID=67385 RepID=UPI00344AC61C
MSELKSPSAGELTETDVEGFIGFVSFLAKNDLWDEVRSTLDAAGITDVYVSTEPIRLIRKLIDEELLPGERLDEGGRRHALVISECGCGVSNPGPPTPVVPHGGGDGGPPQQ